MRKWIAAGLVAVAAVVVAVVLIAGDDDEASAAQQTDDDFIARMIPHHESAIEMAEMAQERAERAEVRELADAIISAQASEIDRMASIHERLFDEGVEGHEHGDLGLSMSEMGMHMEIAELETAKQFDRAFIDAMIPHHQGAIRMARIELERGEDGELAEIAEAIVAAQTSEIEQMNMWHERWYGAPSPAGGPPEEGETMAPSHEMMGH